MTFALITACLIIFCLLMSIDSLNKEIKAKDSIYNQDSDKISEQAGEIFKLKVKVVELQNDLSNFEKMKVDYTRFKDLVEYYKLCNMLMQAKSYVKIYNMPESLIEWIKESNFDKQTEQQYLDLIERIK